VTLARETVRGRLRWRASWRAVSELRSSCIRHEKKTSLLNALIEQAFEFFEISDAFAHGPR
jgi:hypothetical protein